jgi:hypothetical protein
VPGQIVALGHGMENPGHLPGPVGEPCGQGNVPVAGYPA